ncbi:MAG: hypothetical protein M3460_13845 [Actinomycetota bacterium]|nr:hypothetical protein [Actinomycetota bacterium]
MAWGKHAAEGVARPERVVGLDEQMPQGAEVSKQLFGLLHCVRRWSFGWGDHRELLDAQTFEEFLHLIQDGIQDTWAEI